MRVTCGSCKTEYDIDASQVPGEGLSLQCSQCNFVFKVFAPKAEAIQVQTPDGNIYHAKDMAELQRWIVDHRLTRHAMMSHSGLAWKKLQDVPELTPFFSVVEQATQVTQITQLISNPMLTQGAAPVPTPQPAVSPASEQEIPSWALPTPPPEPMPHMPSQSSSQPAPQPQSSVTRAPVAPVSEPEVVHGESNQEWSLGDGSFDMDEIEEPKSGMGFFGWVLTLAMLAAAGVFGVHFVRPDVSFALIGPTAAQADALQAVFDDMAKDSEVSVKRAQGGAIKLLKEAPHWGLARAAEAEAQLVLAEIRRDMSPEEPKNADELATQAYDRLAKDRYAAEGVHARGRARFYVYKGAWGAAQQQLAIAQRMLPDDPLTALLAVYVQGDPQGQPTAQALRGIVASYPELVRAKYLLAQARLEKEDREGAASLLEELLAQSPEHQRAQALLERLQNPQP